MPKIHKCLLLNDRGRIRCIRKVEGRFVERIPGREYTLSEASAFWAWWKESESYDEDAKEVVDLCVVSSDLMWKTMKIPAVLVENTSWKLEEVKECIREYGEYGWFCLSYHEGQVEKRDQIHLSNYNQDKVSAEIWIPSGDHQLILEWGPGNQDHRKNEPSGRESDIHQYYRNKREHERKVR